MLTWDEEDFLSKLPDDKIVHLFPYDPAIEIIAEDILNSAHSVLLNLEVRHMGASALKLSGQGDIDIYIFCNPENFEECIPKLKNVFGEPKSRKYDSVAWKFTKDGHDVELYLTDPTSKPMQRQIAIFEALKENKKLQKEYEDLKMGMNGKKFKDYQRAKYEFYHKILGN